MNKGASTLAGEEDREFWRLLCNTANTQPGTGVEFKLRFNPKFTILSTVSDDLFISILNETPEPGTGDINVQSVFKRTNLYGWDIKMGLVIHWVREVQRCQKWGTM